MAEAESLINPFQFVIFWGNIVINSYWLSGRISSRYRGYTLDEKRCLKQV